MGRLRLRCRGRYSAALVLGRIGIPLALVLGCYGIADRNTSEAEYQRSGIPAQRNTSEAEYQR